MNKFEWGVVGTSAHLSQVLAEVTKIQEHEHTNTKAILLFKVGQMVRNLKSCHRSNHSPNCSEWSYKA